MNNERERRCTDCGAPVDASVSFCPDCWGDSLVWAEGAKLAGLRQWEAYIYECRLHYNGGYGDEPTIVCDGCGKRIEAAEARNSLFNGKPICGRCAGLESEAQP